MSGKVTFDYLTDTDAVQKAIEKGYHNSDLVNQTWEECKDNIANKSVVIYGLGNGIGSFIRDYGDDVHIDRVVDEKKIGVNFADFCYIHPESYFDKESTSLATLEELKIENSKVLDKLDREQTTIIITSLKNYQEIYDMLKKNGFQYCYSYLCMEANKRKYENKKYLDSKNEFLYNCQTLPVNPNLIAAQTIGGYCGHSRQVTEKMRAIKSDYEIVWMVPNRKYEYTFPRGTKIVCQGTPDYYRVMTTAKLWLFEEPLQPEFHKKEGQFCVQLKHWASVTLKVFGHTLNKGLPGCNEEYENKLWKYNDDITDCYVVGSEFDERTIRECFLYTHECFYAGSPRSDLLFNNVDYKAIICDKYSLNYDNKYCLYSPTFRFDRESYCSYKDTELDFYALKQTLEAKFGGKWNVLFRTHPRVLKSKRYLNELPDFVTDVSTYMDSEELVAASDIMVTDYSSIMFEPAFVKKPVFLYAPDLDKYLKEERSFLMNYDELPFPISYNNEELMNNVRNFNKSEYVKKLEAFFTKYGVHEDGHASERAARFILDLLDGKVHEGAPRDNLDYRIERR